MAALQCHSTFNQTFALSLRRTILIRNISRFFAIQASRRSPDIENQLGLLHLADPAPQLSNRRELLAGSAILISFLVGSRSQANAQDDDTSTLVPFTELYTGFTLLKPAEWKQVERSGTVVYFEDPAKKTNCLDLIVKPVLFASLADFGSLEDVAQRLIQAEKKKPNTNGAELLQIHERTINGDIPLYQVEYKRDSDRGIQRIYRSLIIKGKRIFILNLIHDDAPSNPILPDKAKYFEKIVESFEFA